MTKPSLKGVEDYIQTIILLPLPSSIIVETTWNSPSTDHRIKFNVCKNSKIYNIYAKIIVAVI
jgi:hypothetical protein